MIESYSLVGSCILKKLVMFISLKWVIFLKMRCEVSKIMSKMTHVNNKNTNNYFQIGAADSFKCKQIIRNCIIFHWYFHETPGKTPDCKDEDSTDTTGTTSKFHFTKSKEKIHYNPMMYSNSEF